MDILGLEIFAKFRYLEMLILCVSKTIAEGLIIEVPDRGGIGVPTDAWTPIKKAHRRQTP